MHFFLIFLRFFVIELGDFEAKLAFLQPTLKFCDDFLYENCTILSILRAFPIFLLYSILLCIFQLYI